MTAKQAVVINETGIHARPASALINAAKQYQSKITIRNLSRPNSEPVNAKSIMMVLSLAIRKDMEVEFMADGLDEERAVDALVALVESGLGE